MFKKNLIQVHVAIALGLVSSVTYAACTPGTGAAGESTYTCINELTQYNPINGYDHVIVSTSADYNISGPQGFGIYINGTTWNLKNLTVSTSGKDADAIRSNGNGGVVYITEKLVVNTTGRSSDGINASDTTSARFYIGDNAEVTTTSGIAVRANTKNNDSNSLNLIQMGEGAIITTYGSGSNSILTGGLGYAVYAGNMRTTGAGEAKVIMGNNSTITTEGSSAHAVYANRGGVIQLGHTTVETKFVNSSSGKSNAHGLYAETGSTANGNKGGIIDLLGNTKITTPVGAYAIYAYGAGSVIASYNSDTNTETSGIFDVTGDMRVHNGGTIDLIMTNGSTFLGNTSITGTGGTLNLKMDGSSSRWEMYDDSQVSTLHLTNGANVWITDHSTSVTDTDYTTLTMEHLKGTGGVFHMRTGMDGADCSLGTSVGDMLIVTGTSEGHHLIKVSDNRNGSATTDGTELLRMVQTADGVATFGLNHAGNAVDIGAYQYELVRGDSLTRATSTNWWLKSKARSISDPANSSTNILNINYLLSNVENQTLLQRMGEIRRNDNNRGDFWVRGYVGKLSSFEDDALRGFDMDYDGVQMGADKFVGYNTYFGIMMGTSKADVDYEVGSGTTKSHHLGLYGTFKTQDGWYVDAIAKYVHMNNKFDSVTSGGYTVQGHANTSGYSAGLEVGKRFFLQAENAGWYLEPQAQFTYSHQDSAVVRATNGLKTQLGAFDSMIGRVSGIVGYSVVKGENPVDIYLKTGYVKEFDGKTNYTFNDTDKNKYKFNGDWWDNGVGVSAQINKQHNLYLEADYSVGDKFDKKQVNLGYRYAF